MSRNTDDAALLRALDKQGGQVPVSRLTMSGLLAASRLVRKQLAWFDKEAKGGWAVVLIRRDDKATNEENIRGHHPAPPPVRTGNTTEHFRRTSIGGFVIVG